MSTAAAATTVDDLRRAILRNKKKALFCFLLIFAGAVLTAFGLPKKYHSEAKLFVRLGKENATLDSTATLSQEPVVSVPQTRENEINSVVEMLRSRVVVEKVVDSLGPAFILGETGETGETDGLAAKAIRWARGVWVNAKGRWSAMEGGPPLNDRERAVELLLTRYSVRSVRKSDVLTIDGEGPSPEWSRAVVAQLIDVYRDEHVRLNRPQGSLAFFTRQAAWSRQELTRKEEELRDLKTATGLASPADQRHALMTRIARLEDDLLQAEAARAVSESKVQSLQKQLADLPEKRVIQETVGFGNEGTDRMRDQMYQLQVKKEEAAAKYTALHPQMQRVVEQSEAARDILSREAPERTQVTTANNRVREEVQLAVAAEEPLLASQRAKAATLRRQLADVRGELKGLNENELRIAALERETELQQAAYRKYATNLEQARVDQALQDQRISNITVAQPATYEPTPTQPRKLAWIALGLVGGLLGALAAALAAEWRNRTFHTPEDIQRRLDLAVLGSIPRLRTKELKFHATGNGNGQG